MGWRRIYFKFAVAGIKVARSDPQRIFQTNSTGDEMNDKIQEVYVKAMLSDRFSECIEIEQRFDLYGYSPEIVCIGLNAIDDGEDPDEAIREYLNQVG